MRQRSVVLKNENPHSIVGPFLPHLVHLAEAARAVNEKILTPAYPLPIPQALIAQLAKGQFFTTLDLQNGFWNIRLNPSSRPMTVFGIPGIGLFAWTVLPFGIKPGPAEFQRRMKELLKKHILGGYCLVYIDDIIIFSETAEEHAEHVLSILTTLGQGSLALRIGKCQFFTRTIKYLGQIVGQGMIFPDPDRVADLRNRASPSSYKPEDSFHTSHR